jgi:hypothetical protein
MFCIASAKARIRRQRRTAFTGSSGEWYGTGRYLASSRAFISAAYSASLRKNLP